MSAVQNAWPRNRPVLMSSGLRIVFIEVNPWVCCQPKSGRGVPLL
jgi:hypothetical protein